MIIKICKLEKMVNGCVVNIWEKKVVKEGIKE
jgi:hypothetical protein